jgi:hypothetical protein
VRVIHSESKRLIHELNMTLLMSRHTAWRPFLLLIPLLLLLSLFFVVRSHQRVQTQLHLVHALQADSIRYVTLYPFSYSSLITSPLILRDRHTIAQLVQAYHHLRPERAGDGKLSGSWQVTVTFTTYSQREINSDIYHTEYADLVRIALPETTEPMNIGDLLASQNQELSHLLLACLTQNNN